MRLLACWCRSAIERQARMEFTAYKVLNGFSAGV
jgi:hypothetical protein